MVCARCCGPCTGYLISASDIFRLCHQESLGVCIIGVQTSLYPAVLLSGIMPPSRTENRKQSSRKKTKQPLAGEPRQSQLPDWPVLRPLIPRESLSCHVVIPGQIITIPNFWTSSLSKSYVSYLSGLPLVTTPGRPKKGEAVRVNDRLQVNDPSFADRLWNQTALRELLTGPEMADSEDERDQLWGGKVVSKGREGTDLML
jgi:hypothetical protein